MDLLEKLTEAFERFPGIGPRQARRFVQFLLHQNPAYRADLATAIKALGLHTVCCKKCFRWFARPVRSDSLSNGVKEKGKDVLCTICGNPSRDAAVLFIVEKDADIENIERSGFKGLYFVLGGTVPLAQEHPEKFIRAHELEKRIEAEKGVLKEIILGLSATTEGDHTRLILQEILMPTARRHSFKLTSLGRGLSTGSELEYADPDTIAQALENRS